MIFILLTSYDCQELKNPGKTVSQNLPVAFNSDQFFSFIYANINCNLVTIGCDRDTEILHVIHFLTVWNKLALRYFHCTTSTPIVHFADMLEEYWSTATQIVDDGWSSGSPASPSSLLVTSGLSKLFLIEGYIQKYMQNTGQGKQLLDNWIYYSCLLRKLYWLNLASNWKEIKFRKMKRKGQQLGCPRGTQGRTNAPLRWEEPVEVVRASD